MLLLAFALAIMADPISSVAYAIEAALGALEDRGGGLGLLLPTMGLVIAVIGVIVLNYRQVVSRFPEGGGAAAASGRAFGEAWAFVPIGALIVDFVLTIAISVSSGAAAIVAYLPNLSPLQVPLALVLLLVVGAITWYGHSARSLFGLMTAVFLVVGAVVLLGGVAAEPAASGAAPVGEAGGGGAALAVVLLAFPVAMALATGVEAPSSAIAQLGQLDDGGRRRFGHVTLYATLGTVGVLTLSIAFVAVRLGVGLPSGESINSTLIAEVARASVGSGALFAVFQAVTALLLLAAGASAFQAGPGLLKALAREGREDGGGATGVLPSWLGSTNRHYTPFWGVAVYAALTAAVVAAAGADEQSLVLFYAVSVFLSFLAGLVAMVAFSYRERSWGSLALNVAGASIVAFVLAINLARGLPVVSLGAALLIALGLYALWVKKGRPRGIASAAAE